MEWAQMVSRILNSSIFQLPMTNNFFSPLRFSPPTCSEVTTYTRNVFLQRRHPDEFLKEFPFTHAAARQLKPRKWPAERLPSHMVRRPLRARSRKKSQRQRANCNKCICRYGEKKRRTHRWVLIPTFVPNCCPFKPDTFAFGNTKL